MLCYWYILKQFLKFFCLSLYVILFIFMLFDILHKINFYFPLYGTKPDIIIRYYIFQIPFILAKTAPLATLFAAVTVMFTMGQNNEITAMRSFGFSPYHIALPLVIGSILICAFMMIFSEIIIPFSSFRTRHLMHQHMEPQIQSIISKTKWLKNENNFIQFSKYDFKARDLVDVEVLSFDSTFHLQTVLYASKGHLDFETQRIKLIDVKKIVLEPQKSIITHKESLAFKEISFPIDKDLFKEDWRKPEEFSLFELKDILTANNNIGNNRIIWEYAWYNRWASLFVIFIFSLASLKFGFVFERSKESIGSLFFLVFLAFFYWLILSVSRAATLGGKLYPFLVAWIGNFVLTFILMKTHFKILFPHRIKKQRTKETQQSQKIYSWGP